ncbi:MAG: hypothetical protein M3680_02895 [Myxococcota bacterium]|nr:hypothetical protein [Myxococcota bacterium]
MRRALLLVVAAGCSDGSSHIEARWSGCEPTAEAPGDLRVEVSIFDADGGTLRELVREDRRCSDGGFDIAVEPANDYQVFAVAYRGAYPWLKAWASFGVWSARDRPAHDFDIVLPFEIADYAVTGVFSCEHGTDARIFADFIDLPYTSTPMLGECGVPFVNRLRRGRYVIEVMSPDYELLATSPVIDIVDRDVDVGAF